MHPTEREDVKPPSAIDVQILVWDLPTRLFHWLLVALVVASFVTVNLGGVWMTTHMKCGYVILGLLVFRIAWGIVGGRYARFSSFVRGPAVVLGYARNLMRQDAPKQLGHNPMGGWSVLAMLISIMIQAVSGLFANDDIFIKGPLYPFVGKANSDWLTHIHRLNQEVLLLLVGLHLMAVLFYLIIKHENLILPMFTGRKRWHAKDQASDNPLGTAALIAILTAIGVYLLVH